MVAMLKGEIAIVTGSSGLGTGSEIAHVFASEGARVIVTGRDATNGERVVAQILADGGEAAFIRADLSDRSDCEELVQRTLDHWGGLSCLVHCAVATEAGSHVSHLGDAPIATVSDDVWGRNLQVNLLSFRWLCQLTVPVMQRSGRGTIVNVGSRVAERGHS